MRSIVIRLPNNTESFIYTAPLHRLSYLGIYRILKDVEGELSGRTEFTYSDVHVIDALKKSKSTFYKIATDIELTTLSPEDYERCKRIVLYWLRSKEDDSDDEDCEDESIAMAYNIAQSI